MPTLEWLYSEYESRHHWKKDGDEWDGNAVYCDQPYELWKESVIETFINPNVSEESSVLEYGVGRGRWTEPIIKKAKETIVVDLSPACIDFCKRRFAQYNNVRFLVNDGKDLSLLADNSIDFIWSFATFTQVERDVSEAILREFHRVLKPGARAVIHHSARRNSTLWMWDVLKHFGRLGGRLYQIISMHKFRMDDGYRSNVSKEQIADMALKCGLKVESQVASWGKESEFSVGLFRDYISTLIK